MRILLFDNEFRDYTVQLANALHEQNIQVQVALSEPSPATPDQDDFLSPGVTSYRYVRPRLYSPENFILLYVLWRMITRYKPDIIHSQGIPFWFSLVLPIIHLLRYPVIVTLHDPKPHLGETYLRTRIANRLAWIFAARIFVHGEMLKEVIIGEYAYPAGQTVVTTSGEHEVAPFTRYSSVDIGEEGHTVLFFGRIREYKGLEYLIRAEPDITKEIPDVKIVIAGKGESFEKYRSMIVHPERFGDP